MTKYFIRYDDNGGLGAYAGIKEFATADLGGKVFDRTDDVLAAIAALKASEEPYHHYLAKQLETAEGRLTHFKLAAVSETPGGRLERPPEGGAGDRGTNRRPPRSVPFPAPVHQICLE